MLASFTHKGDGTPSIPGEEPVVQDLVFWMKAIALNVLSGAAFNLHIPWPTKSIVGSNEVQASKPVDCASDIGTTGPEIHLMSWQHCMNTIMEHFYWLIGFSQWQLEHSPWKFMRDLPAAYAEFMDYIEEMIDDASSKTATPSEDGASTSKNPLPKRNDLLSNILRANENDL
jgi:hypothetical protein